MVALGEDWRDRKSGKRATGKHRTVGPTRVTATVCAYNRDSATPKCARVYISVHVAFTAGAVTTHPVGPG